ncbi:MAG: hypothetical protein IJI36_14945 [Kiritimatiellae bacterium]|nr:hypothetical protein [Kiritimatiellia bacterium]
MRDIQVDIKKRLKQREDMFLRRLDRVRDGMLTKVWRMLPEQVRLGHHRYKGRPYSYFGFLEKAVRPTNMTRWRIRVLPYSEL